MNYVISDIHVDAIMNIEVIFDSELQDDSGSEVAAATYKEYKIPEGDLPPADKKVVMSSQAREDYISFIQAVRSLLNDYNLHIYYDNESEYNSFYGGVLAKDDQGNNLLKLRTRFCVSTHPYERTPASQKAKKNEEKAAKKVSKGKTVHLLPIRVVVNNESTQFDSYLEAIA